jgi:hypothetical protein
MVLRIARGVDVEFNSGILVGIALLTEGTLLAIEHQLVLAVFPKLLASLVFLIVFLTYTYRFYANQADAGRYFYLLSMLVAVFLLIVFGVASSVIYIKQAAAGGE